MNMENLLLIEENESEINILLRQVNYCNLCNELSRRCPITIGVRAYKNGLFFVGQNPDETEVVQQKAFVGDAGKNFNEVYLGTLETERDDVVISNCVKCYTSDFKVTPRMLDNCFIHLANEINFCKPKLIVAMGVPAIKSLVGLTVHLHLSHGMTFKSIIHGYHVFCTYHPMAFTYNPKLKDVVKADMLKLKEFINA